MSPRSLEAVNLLGLTVNELYLISMKEFFDLYPEYKCDSAEHQKKRYLHFEEKREQKIKQAIIVLLVVIFRKGMN